jgi:hypothetical protein
MLFASTLNLKCGRQRSFIRHPLVNTSGEKMIGEMQFFFPVFHALSLAVIGKQMISSGITTLLAHCRPSAIGLFVRTTVVIRVAIQRMLWTRATSHVFQEMLKGLHPAFTDGYPSAAIAHVVTITRIKATIFHTSPNVIFWRIPQTVRGETLPLKATTALCAPRDKKLTANEYDSATGTPAPPLGAIVTCIRAALQYMQASKWGRVGQIANCWHHASYTAKMMRICRALNVVGHRDERLRNRPDAAIIAQKGLR